MLHRLRPDLPVIARARDADHAVRLFSMGAVQVIPEAFETGLDLAGVTLRRLGAPAEHTHALLETRREAMLRLLRSEPGPG
jgi:CPA2 family monovalent cation:H+ antiporter-2